MSATTAPILIPTPATETWSGLTEALETFAYHADMWPQSDPTPGARAASLAQVLHGVQAPHRWTAEDFVALVHGRPDGRPDPAFFEESLTAAGLFEDLGLPEHAELAAAWARFVEGIAWPRIGADPETGAPLVPGSYTDAADEFFSVQQILRDKAELGAVLRRLVTDRAEVSVLDPTAYMQAMVDMACASKKFEIAADALSEGDLAYLPRSEGARGKALARAEASLKAPLFLAFGTPMPEGGWRDVLYGADGFWSLDLPPEEAEAILQRWPGGGVVSLSDTAAPQPEDPAPAIEQAFHRAVREAAFPKEAGWRKTLLRLPTIGPMLEPLIQLMEPVALFRMMRGLGGWGVSDLYLRHAMLDVARAGAVFGLIIWAMWLKGVLSAGPDRSPLWLVADFLAPIGLVVSGLYLLHALVKLTGIAAGTWARAHGRGCRGHIDLAEAGHDNWMLRAIRSMQRGAPRL